MGGVLSQSLAARQNRALHPRGELYGRLHVADPCERRNCDLGNAGARLSHARTRIAALRTARMPAGDFLLVVSLQPAAREVSVSARRAARSVEERKSAARRSGGGMEVVGRKSRVARAVAARSRQGRL